MIGAMNCRVIIGSKGSSRDANNQLIETFTPKATVWAAFEDSTGREFIDAQRVNAEMTHLIRIHYPRQFSVDARDLVRFGSKTFDVMAVNDRKQEHKSLWLSCKEIA